MGQNTDFLFKIGETARLFGVSVQTLRHYDDLGIVKPEKVDPETGYRYYAAEQFEALNTVRYLRECDMPLRDIAAFYAERSPEKMHDIMVRQERELDRRLCEMETMRNRLRQRRERLDEALRAPLGDIREKRFGARRFAVLRQSVAPVGYLDLEMHIQEIQRNGDSSLVFLGKVGVGIESERLMARDFHGYDMVFIELDDVEDYGGPVLEQQPERCLVVRFSGNHTASRPYYERLLEEAAGRGLESTGFAKEFALLDDGMTLDPTQIVTEIQLPVR